MVRIRITFDPCLANADTLCRTISLLSFRAFTIQLHKHRVINVTTERPLDSFQIGTMAVRGDLRSNRQARAKVVHKGYCGFGAAFADEP